MSEKKFITGDTAVAYAVKLTRVNVVSAYPITPQTPIVERIASFIANGEMKADYIRVEGEHSAMAGCLGACMAGARAFTATSSHGLAYMHEMLTYVSGGRFPIVLAVANRSIAPPWSIWGEHQDSIQQRDTGCIQLYVESAQEALDTVIQAFKIAENPKVFTPVMVCLDGFNISHTEELVEIPDQDDVDRFLPPFRPNALLDPDEPMSLTMGAGARLYTTWRFEQQQAIMESKDVIEEVDKEFRKIFGRSYNGLVDASRCEDAEVVLVAMGGMTTGAAREAADNMRNDGVRAGVLKLRAYRPFPNAVVRQYLGSAKSVVVIDRDCSYGNEGAVCSDVKAALCNLHTRPTVTNFIGGLGGADIMADEIQKIATKALQTSDAERDDIVFQFMEER
ncbi:transketolase C-terminal domain-containing protein [Chloroflexota bacterium]